MALLTSCQNTFQNVTAYEEAVDDVEALKVQVRECYTEITKTSEQISSTARETYVTKSDLETFQQDFQTSITETATEIRMDFSERADTIANQVATNQTLLEEYIRFRGALIELHYHFRFNYPSDKEIEEYLKDKLDEQFYDQIPSVISFSKRIGLTYDCLRALAFEINCGETFKRAIEDLNIVNTEGEQYNLTLYFKDGGTLVCRREYIDMYGWESVYIDFRDKSSKMALEVHFELADCIYDGFTGNMQIDGQAVEVSSYYQKEYKDREISRITVVRCGQRSIHYAV